MFWSFPGKPITRFYLDDSAFRPDEADKILDIARKDEE
jgi:hypothetical protein